MRTVIDVPVHHLSKQNLRNDKYDISNNNSLDLDYSIL